MIVQTFRCLDFLLFRAARMSSEIVMETVAMEKECPEGLPNPRAQEYALMLSDER